MEIPQAVVARGSRRLGFRQSFALDDACVHIAAVDLAFEFFSSGGLGAAAGLVRLSAR
jgi:hypothetical protein